MDRDFIAVRIAILTVSDTRTESDDVSGKTLKDRLLAAGHELADKKIVTDDIYQIRSVISQWICDEQVDVIITTGGTGLTGRDGTPEAVKVLFDKEITGFGELFRQISVANGTFIFCLPGSSGACKNAWDDILQYQLDVRHRPCNFVELIPRLREK